MALESVPRGLHIIHVMCPNSMAQKGEGGGHSLGFSREGGGGWINDPLGHGLGPLLPFNLFRIHY